MKLPPNEKNAELYEEDGNHQLDVRPIMLSGGSPFSCIMYCVQQLQKDEILCLHTVFDPIPLREQLARRKFHLEISKKEIDHWILRIQKGD